MRNRAFTLIELLVVISIVALLSSVVLAALSQARIKGTIAAGQQFAGNLLRTKEKQALYVPFNEGSGTAVADRALGRAGAIGGSTVTWVKGIADSAISFGSSAGRVTFPGTAEDTLVRSPDTFSIAAWVYPTEGNAGTAYPILAGQANNTMMFSLYGLTPELRMDDGSMRANKDVPLNQWTHVAVSFEGGVATFYINGAFAGKMTNSDTNGSSGYTIPEIYVGYEARYSYAFKGYIDEVLMLRETI